MSKGVFIEGITVDMFRNASLEAIETLLAEGDFVDVELPRWIPCSERLPRKYIGEWLCCLSDGTLMILPYDTPGDGTTECKFYYCDDDGYPITVHDVVAWMPLPPCYQEENNE